jgi:hypothetical protein
MAATVDVEQNQAGCFSRPQVFARNAAALDRGDPDAWPECPQKAERQRQTHDPARLPREKLATWRRSAFRERAVEPARELAAY